MNAKPAGANGRVSLSKPAAANSAAQPPADPGPRPRSVLFAAIALAVSAVSAVIASLDLYGLKDWLTQQQIKSNNKAIAKAVSDAAKAHKDQVAAKAAEIKKLGSLSHAVSQQQSGALIGSLIAALAVSFLVFGVYRGRHWSRWGVIAFWFLASFTGTLVGLGAVLNVGSSAPPAFKIPAFIAGAAMVAAVVLVNMRTSTVYFAAHRPVQPANAPVRRGLFAPRTPPPSRPTANAKPAAKSDAQRQRAKNRAASNADAIAHGAELARQRAKASKSRRAAE